MAELWVDTQLGREVTAELVAKVCAQYQVTAELAEDIVVELLRTDRVLGEAVRSGQSLKQIQRMKVFKDLVSRARKNAYYTLRRYDRTTPEAMAALAELDAHTPGTPIPDDLRTSLARCHVSTAERLGEVANFHAGLFAHIGSPERVLDVGCGIYPVLFSFAEHQVREYVALDKDPRSIDILERYAKARGDGVLVPMRVNLADGWDAIADRGRFDVAFLFKLVSVVRRRDRLALNQLLTVPADLVVLTGAAKSMTKHADISRRERAILLSFVEEAELSVVADFVTGDECVVVASVSRARSPRQRVASS